MRVEEPLVHGPLVERLWRAAVADRLPHALLFEGHRGTGRFLAARWFAAGLLCAAGPGRPCGVCGPCKRVASGGSGGNHPDLFLVDPLEEGEERIKIARIARRGATAHAEGSSVEEFLDLVPLESEHRVVLLREAHRMNAAAQNALLKTLEEPRPGTVLVLESHRPGDLLPTLRSRCVRVRFDALGPEDGEVLVASASAEAGSAAALARLARGAPGVALELAERGAPELLERVEEALTRARRPHELARLVQEQEGEFPGGTPSARARERARTLIDLALDVVGDLLRAAEGVAPGALAHGERVERLAGRVGGAGLRRRLEGLLAARADVERNVQPEALVERALLVLAEGDPVLCRPLP